MQIKKYETKDRYGNSKSFEFFEGSADMDIPGMTDMPDHPGEPKGTDTVPAWLTPGEFVINKEATDMYGPLLKNINDEGRKMQNGEPHNHPSEAMYAADGDVVPDTPMTSYEMYQYILSLGFNENAARGIMSNIKHEANFDSAAVQLTNSGNPVKGGGMGLFQWEKGDPDNPAKGGRYDTDYNNLLKFARENNRNWTDPKTQLDFMNYEMRPQPADVEANKWRKWAQLRVDMNNAASAGEAAQMFAKDYERHKGNPQLSRTTYADDDSNFLNPNREGYVDGIETYESSDVNRPIPNPTYKEAGGLIPQYYAVGDSVRDYYRDGVLPLGSAGTMPTGSTWDLLTAAKAEEEEKRERERKLFSAGKLDDIIEASLVEDNVPETIKKLVVPSANSPYKGDELRDYYRDGVPMPGSVGTMSSDSTWDQKTAEEKEMAEFRNEIQSHLKNFNNAEKLRKEEEKVSGINEVSSNLIEDPQDINTAGFMNNVPKLNEPKVVKSPPTKKEIKNLVKKKYEEVGLAENKNLVPNSFATSWGQHFNNVGMKDLNDVVESKNRRVLEAKNDLIKAIQKGAPQKQIDILKQRWKEATQGAALASDTAIVTERHEDKYRIDKQLEEAKLTQEQSLIKLERLKNAGLLEEAEKERLALIENENLIKELEIQENNAAESFDTSFTGVTPSGNAVTEGIATVINGDPDVTAVDGGDVKSNTLLPNDKSKVTTSEVAIALDTLNQNADNASTKEGNNDSTILTGDLKNQLDKIPPKIPETLMQKAKGMLKRVFGKLFDGDELARMAVLYAGSRLAGGSHEGSLAWSAKGYLERVDTKEADHKAQVKKYIEDGDYTIKTIKLFDKTKDFGVLLRRGVPIESTGKTIMLYSPQLGKFGTGRQQAFEQKQGDNTYWSWDQAGQKPVSYSANGITWSKDDAHRVYNTKEFKVEQANARKVLLPIIEGLRNDLDKIPRTEGQIKDGVKEQFKTGLANANDTMEMSIRWANRNNVSANEMSFLMKQAYEIAVQQSESGKKIGDLTPILNELRIADQLKVPEAFKYEDKGGVLRYMSPESLQELTNRIDKAMNGGIYISQRPTADMYGAQQARKNISDSYKALQQVWQDKSAGFDSTGYYAAVATAEKEKTALPKKEDYTSAADGEAFKTLWTKRAKGKKVSGFFEWASSQTYY